MSTSQNICPTIQALSQQPSTKPILLQNKKSTWKGFTIKAAAFMGSYLLASIALKYILNSNNSTFGNNSADTNSTSNSSTAVNNSLNITPTIPTPQSPNAPFLSLVQNLTQNATIQTIIQNITQNATIQTLPETTNANTQVIPNNKPQKSTTPLNSHLEEKKTQPVEPPKENEINLKDKDGNTPLLNSMMNKNEKHTLSLLSQDEVDINLQNNKGETALHIAIQEEKWEAIELLLTKNANIDLRDNFGNTLLHLALKLAKTRDSKKQKNIDLALRLISMGIDVNAQNKLGLTALHHAAFLEDLQLTEKLFERGVTVYKKDRMGNTPLHFAVSHKENPANMKIVSMLIDRLQSEGISNIDLNSCNDLRALTLPIYENYYGGNPSYSSNNGVTALHMAVFFENFGALEQLLNAGADINAITRLDEDILSQLDEYDVSPVGKNALHIAVTHKNSTMTERLIKGNININLQTRHNVTALHVAAGNGNIDAVRLLLKHGANLKFKNSQQQTPLDIAKKEQKSNPNDQNFSDIIALLAIL